MEPGHNRADPCRSQPCARLLVRPVSRLWLDNLRTFTVPGPSCSSLEDSGRGEGRLKLLSSPVALRLDKPVGMSEGREHLAGPSTPGLAAEASETIQGSRTRTPFVSPAWW